VGSRRIPVVGVDKHDDVFVEMFGLQFNTGLSEPGNMHIFSKSVNLLSKIVKIFYHIMGRRARGNLGYSTWYFVAGWHYFVLL